MRILVCFKVLPDPDRILEEDFDSFSLSKDLSYGGLDFNCFDASALEMALKLKEQAAVQGTEVLCTALTVCNGLPPAFSERLYSVGYDRVLEIPRKNREFCPESIAEILAEAGKDYDLILMGREAGLGESGMVPYLTAAELEYPLVSGAEKAGWDQGLTLFCRDEQGLWEKQVSLPLVAVADNSPEVLRMATLRQRMQHRGKLPEILKTEVPDRPAEEPEFGRPDTGRTCTFLDPEADETYEMLRQLFRQTAGKQETPKMKELHDKSMTEKLCWAGEPNGESGEVLEQLCHVRTPLILLPDTHAGKSLAGRLSVKTGRACRFSGEIREICDTYAVTERRCFGSNLTVRERLSLPAVLTCPDVAGYGSVQKLTGEKNLPWILSETLREPALDTGLSTASAVMVCGNGMGSREVCENVRALADKMGAAVGFTRPAALNAWGSPQEILGQSGLKIAPECCLTLGAAGAGPFLLGVQGAKILIAVNRDPNALIFKNADYGLIMDTARFLEKFGKEE